MTEAVLSVAQEAPAKTLGWAVLEWVSRYIRQPDGPETGGPWEFTREQLFFVLNWYSIDDRGRFRWTRGVLRRPKGWGKSPVVGALSLAELCGPVRFGGWDPAGEPIAVPVSMPWVQLAGVSEKQTTNTMSMVLGMVNESPIVADYGLDIGLTRIYTPDGGRLEPITASAPTAEGARPTFVVEDESHHWTETNGGVKLDQVNRRNLGKSRDGAARCLETTNAHAPGQGSVAEKSYEAWTAGLDGRARTASVLYDAREAPADTDMADEVSLMAGLVAAYGDSTWVDLERIREEVYDLSTPPEDSRRFYLNQIASASDSWLTEMEIRGAVADPDVGHVDDKEAVTLGFDGSRSRERGVTDSTALMGCRVSDGHLFLIEAWEQPQGPAGAGWEVPRTAVDATVRAAFDLYSVVGFYADPAKWESYIGEWEAAFGRQLQVQASKHHPIEWWMTGGRAVQAVRATARLHSAIVERNVTHDGSATLVRHLLNARRRVGTQGVMIAKENPESPRKIDVAVAAILAHEARADAVAAGVTGIPKSRKVYGFH